MIELLWLLLPIAAASGWYAAKRTQRKQVEERLPSIPGEYIQGLNHLLNEETDKALEIFIRMVEVDSDTVETHLVLGQLFRRRGEVERAIRIHQNLIARPNLDTNNKMNALFELGRDYLKAGLLDRAEGLFKEVIQMGGRVRDAYALLKELYEQEKDWDSAIQAAINLQSCSGVSEASVIAHYYCEISEAQASRGQLKPAVESAKIALAYDRNCVRAGILLGDLAFEHGDYKTAINHYGDVQQQDPSFLSMVLPKLKLAYEKSNDQHGFLRYLEKIKSQCQGVSSVLSLIDSLQTQGDAGSIDHIFAAELQRPNVPLKIIREYVNHAIKQANGYDVQAMQKIAGALETHIDEQASHQCNDCGFQTKGMFWQCPGCHGWGTIKPIDHFASLSSIPAHYTV